jgi:hypothetical protein
VTIADQHHIIFAGTVGSGTGRYIAGSDNLYVAANRSGEKIFLESTYQDAPYFRCSSGDYKIIHAGNISSQSVNYASSAGSASSVAWSNVSGRPTNLNQFTNGPGYITSSGTVRYMSCPDTRSTMSAPGDYSASSTGVSFDFKYYTASGLPSGYAGIMTVRPYSSSQDWTGGAAHQLAFNGADNRLYHRTGTSSWSSTWYKIAYTGDIPSTISWSNVTGKPSSYTPASHSHDYLPLSGGTLTGLLYINTNGNNAYIGSANSSWFHFQNGANISFYFSNSVYSNGNFYLYSDRSKKKNIKDIPVSSLESLFSVSDKIIKQFTWKSSGKASCGFIAQQLEKYVPEAVSVGPDGSKTITYDTAYAKLIASLIYKIKAQEKQISMLLEHVNFPQEH